MYAPKWSNPDEPPDSIMLPWFCFPPSSKAYASYKIVNAEGFGTYLGSDPFQHDKPLSWLIWAMFDEELSWATH